MLVRPAIGDTYHDISDISRDTAIRASRNVT
jgi:hypothetical protein